MTILDHVGFAVADYQRSKAFYEEALAPLGFSLLMEFSGASAGFGKDGERPSFFIEAHGEPVRGRLHIALSAESRTHVDAFHAAALEAGGTDNGAPGPRWYHPDYYGGYVLDPDGNNIEAVCHQAG
jgi:catechol 2,3-dioxygenase-like lactoylglutathione lyase family enzyme